MPAPPGCPWGQGARGGRGRPDRGGFWSCTGHVVSGACRRRMHRPGLRFCHHPGAPPRRTNAPPRTAVVQQIAVKPFVLPQWIGLYIMSKGGRILRGIRLNTIYGVFGIGGICGRAGAMRGREMPERGVNWEGNRLFLGKECRYIGGNNGF